MKNKLTRQIVHIILLVIGLGLMVGGIITGKPGATVIGLIVSAVSVQQWIEWNKKEKQQQ
ncbi:MAG: hypothetical protein IH598_10420 [Bacteroidales bacterium]|nr:hypothetical protein [Bacteroidales bacterium]